MKNSYINLSISFIIAIVVFVIPDATIAETKLYMLDSSASNSLFSDQDIISLTKSHSFIAPININSVSSYKFSR